jgi:bacteriocin-like protein
MERTTTQDTDRCLSDNELNTVNGGVYHLVGAAALLTELVPEICTGR